MNDFPITVVVSTYNRPDALDLVLRACLDQTDRHYDLVVADDGSRDDTRDLVARHAANASVAIEHVWHPDDGFRAAEIRNKGIVHARGDYLIFLDGDCVPQHDFVAQHRRLARPGVTITGSRILLDESLTRRVIGGLGSIGGGTSGMNGMGDANGIDGAGGTGSGIALADQGLGFWLGQRLAGHVNKIAPLFLKLPDRRWRDVEAFRWKGIKSCNMSAWKADLERVNGFDSSFVGWGHEDADLVARLCNAGVTRKLGAYATEVWHLWHEEQPRHRASANYEVVKARIANKIIKAARGLAEL